LVKNNQTFKDERYPPLHIFVDRIDDEAYPKISKSHLHNVVLRPIVLPHAEVIRWIIEHVKLEERMVLNHQGYCISLFHPNELPQYYKFVECEVDITYELVVGFKKDYNKVLEKWWIEGK
jgi:hypothetical protein